MLPFVVVADEVAGLAVVIMVMVVVVVVVVEGGTYAASSKKSASVRLQFILHASLISDLVWLP